MASKTKFLLLAAFFLLSTLLLFTGKASQEDSHNSTQHDDTEVNVSGIVSALKEKDYNAAARTLETILSSLIGNQNSTGFTIFCATDVAYALSRYVQPPPTLVAYQVTQFYLQREDLELRSGVLRMHSGINTLLPGHPLVVTTQLPSSTNLNSDIQAELNLVNVIDWNIYDDGKVIVHGVRDFFDPAIQTILFPSLEHHEIVKTITSEEKEQILDFLSFFGLFALLVSGLAFLADLYLRSSSEGYVVLEPKD